MGSMSSIMGNMPFLVVVSIVVIVIGVVVKKNKRKKAAIEEFKNSEPYAFALQIKQEIENEIEKQTKKGDLKEGCSWSSNIVYIYHKPYASFMMRLPEAKTYCLLIEASTHKPCLESSINYKLNNADYVLHIKGHLLENINMGVYLSSCTLDLASRVDFDWLVAASKKMKALGYGTGNYYYEGELCNDDILLPALAMDS